MLKNAILTFITIISITLPSQAYKEIGAFDFNQKYPAKVIDVRSIFDINLKFGQVVTTAYVPNIDCNEYSRTYALKSTDGKTYLRARQKTLKINPETTDHIINIFEKNSNNIYFIPYGYGLFSNVVGEFFIGNTSLSQYLIKNGYCSYVE